MKKLFFTLLFVALTASAFAEDAAGTRRPADLCNAAAHDFFVSYTNMNRSQRGNARTMSYTHHYNKKLNKCFIVISTLTPAESASEEVLYDVNGHEVYGTYYRIGREDISLIPVLNNDKAPEVCNLLGKQCRSSEEWHRLIEPSMQN